MDHYNFFVLHQIRHHMHRMYINQAPRNIKKIASNVQIFVLPILKEANNMTVNIVLAFMNEYKSKFKNLLCILSFHPGKVNDLITRMNGTFVELKKLMTFPSLPPIDTILLFRKVSWALFSSLARQQVAWVLCVCTYTSTWFQSLLASPQTATGGILLGSRAK